MTQPEPEETEFVSYAQNGEDVVLWRALGSVPAGRYVDVGAADPVIDSVTLALYERGWRGIHVEPVPAYAAALAEARPGDTVVACGAGAQPGTLNLTVIEGTGLSTFDPVAAGRARLRAMQIPDAKVSEVPVSIRTLDDILSEHLEPDTEIHLLKIDVEGVEADVIAGIDLRRWRPWVIVVESTEPNSTTATQDAWEPALVVAGYRFCMFDGLNRFYVRDDHDEVAPLLSYPACPLDGPYRTSREAALHRHVALLADEVERRERRVLELTNEHQRRAVEFEALSTAHRLLAEDHQRVSAEHRRMAESHQALVLANATAQAEAAGLRVAYERMLSSVSWRVTAPLRSIRSRARSRGDVQGSSAKRTLGADTTEDLVRSESDAGHRDWFHRRLRQAAVVLSGDDLGAMSDSSVDLFGAYSGALAATTSSPLAVAWVSYVAATGRFPDEMSLRNEARILRREGPEHYPGHLVDLHAEAVRSGRASAGAFDVVQADVLIDVTHTAQHDLQTGIQRVVRETCSRWLVEHETVAVWWDAESAVLRRVPAADVERLRDWRRQLVPAVPAGQPEAHDLRSPAAGIVLPWRSSLVLPELAAEPPRAESYRALACSDVIAGLSLIGYDLIPVTAAETVAEGMANVFTAYLSMVKRADRLAAISESAAEDFRGFNQALQSQGLPGPVVEAHPLPPSPAAVDDASLASFRARMGLGDLPLVLVVGSHEPRKNHLTVLDAAEQLWSSGLSFVLLLVGGSGWRSDLFDREIERLHLLGRPVRVSRGASEDDLWAAYRLARFTVFPSLVEGYGLPIVESIASGTPVITTNYGSMAEVALDGGALLVDPHDSDMLAAEMRRLLIDDEELERLRAEAAERRFPTWDEYADSVWRFLVRGERAR